MAGIGTARLSSITEFSPSITPEELAGSLVPPPQFSSASFENYRPDEKYPSQIDTRDALEQFADQLRGKRAKPAKAAKPAKGEKNAKGGFFQKKPPVAQPYDGIYLDGGFGVGKTHLLAALWHLAPGPKHFGTFIEYTALVGALGYNGALSMLSGSKLICIDEFELDDPGDTMMMTRLLGALAEKGTKLAATSNTPPNALGEGRFASQDFLREIQGLSDRFTILRIDGEDYRRRESSAEAVALSTPELQQQIGAFIGEGIDVAQGSWEELITQLAKIHPARYVKIAAELGVLAIGDAKIFSNQNDALRFVAFVDRLYDAQVPILSSGVPLDQVFAEDMLAGGYRKKYLRAISRLISLTSRAAAHQGS